MPEPHRASIEDARANARDARVSDRVTFSTTDATSTGGRYDLVCCFEALHDMAHPVEVLSAMRSVAAPDGTVFIVYERAADALTDDDPDPMQRFTTCSASIASTRERRVGRVLPGRHELRGVGCPVDPPAESSEEPL